LLLIRVRALTTQGRQPEVLEAAEALGELEADEAEDLYSLAQCLASCIGYLDDDRWPESSPRRQAVRQRCADRAVLALTRAVGRGFKDLRGMAEDQTLNTLRQHPGYRELVERWNRPLTEFNPPQATPLQWQW
jgi:hypothetical protein